MLENNVSTITNTVVFTMIYNITNEQEKTQTSFISNCNGFWVHFVGRVIVDVASASAAGVTVGGLVGN